MSVIICTMCGLIIGYTYDFFRALRITSKYNKGLTLISDFLFWAVAAIIIILTFFYIDGLNIRFYRFLAIISGVFLYFTFLSSFFLGISEKFFEIFRYFFKFLFTIIKFCGKILYIAWNFVSYPFRFLFNISKKVFCMLRSNLNKLKRFLKRI